MPGSFIDSNVLVYLASQDLAKADRAERAIASGGTISVQVLNEVANVARRKMKMSWTELDAFLHEVRVILNIVPLTVETHDKGLELAERYGLSTYDSMIVASARLAGCETLWSEDMQHGLMIEYILTIRNPFLEIGIEQIPVTP